MTLAQAVEYFLIDQRLKGNTDKTVKGYRGFLGRFCSWMADNGVISLMELGLQNINDYQLYINSKSAERGSNKNLSRWTVQTYMRHIKAFLSFCYAEGLISEPVHLRVKTPKAGRPVIEVLTDDELSLIFSCFNKSELGLRNKALIFLMLDCGLRLSELPRIKSSDINFDKGYMVVIGKGNKERIVPLGLKVRRVMLSYIYKRRAADKKEDDRHFFLTSGRKPLTTSGITSLMGRLKECSGVPRLHAHLFRHTYATNFLVYGLGDVYELSRLLGHSEIRTTEKYLQVASYYTIMEKRKRLSYLDMLD